MPTNNECLRCGEPADSCFDSALCRTCFDAVMEDVQRLRRARVDRDNGEELVKNKLGAFPRAKENLDAIS